MELVNIKPSGNPLSPVGDNPVLDALHHHQHGDGGQFRAQVTDPVHGKAVVHVHVGLVVKDIQGAIDKQLQGQGNILCLILRLLHQDPIKIGHDRNILLLAFRDPNIKPAHAAVNNGFLPRVKVLHHALLAQPQHKLPLLPDHSFAVV